MYVSATDEVKQGDLVFWGEWEPESKVEKIDNPVKDGPKFIHRPYYVVPRSFVGLQNTDPFVFGEHFHYTFCQQPSRKGLRHLSRGSVIAFGSCAGRKVFVLDTIFVVDSWIDHTRANYQETLAGALSREYEEVTIRPIYQMTSSRTKSCIAEGKICRPAGSDPQETWRLYFGATYGKSVHGMYSFFPCQAYGTATWRFSRPRIRLSQRITSTHNQGVKYSHELSLDDMKSLWNDVVTQVKAQGLGLGVHTEMPERVLSEIQFNREPVAVVEGRTIPSKQSC